MADEHERGRTPEEMLRELGQQNPEAAESVAKEIEQAGATLGQAIASATDAPHQSVDDQVREAGEPLAAAISEPPREIGLDTLGDLSPTGGEPEQPWSWEALVEEQAYEPPEPWPGWEIAVEEPSLEQDEATLVPDQADWFTHVAEAPEPESTPEPTMEQGRDLTRDELEH